MTSHDEQSETVPFYGDMADDLREKLFECADQILGIGMEDAIRGPILTNWCHTAVDLYRLLGLDESAVFSKVRGRAESLLGHGLGKEESLDVLATLEEHLVEPYLQGVGPKDIADLRDLYWSMPEEATRAMDGSRVGLEDTINLLHDVDDEEGMRWAIGQLVRTGGFGQSMRGAAILGDDRLLMAIGLAALSSNVDRDGLPHHNTLNTALSAFVHMKDAEMKERLKPLLIGINQMTLKDDRLRLSTAIRALRVTGEYLGEYPLEGSFQDHITRVNDADIARPIKERSEEALEQGQYWEAIKGLRSVGDTFRLDQIGEMLIMDEKYELAADAFTGSRNQARFLHAVEMHIHSPSVYINPVRGEVSHLHSAAEKYLHYGHVEGLTELGARAQEELIRYEEYSDEASAWEWLRDDSARYLQWLTVEEKRPRHIRQGESEARLAHERLQGIIDYDGGREVLRKYLIDYGDRKLRRDDGLNARSYFLMAVALDELEDER